MGDVSVLRTQQQSNPETAVFLCHLSGLCVVTKTHRGMVFHQNPAAGGNFIELYHHKDGMVITFFDDGNAMGWET